MTRPTEAPRLLPELWRVAAVARELGMQTHSLVAASRRGQFPRVVQVGRTWFARAADVRDWFARQHAADDVSPLLLDRIRAAGEPVDGARPARRRRPPRAGSAGSC